MFYDVYVEGKFFDTVFYSYRMSELAVRDKLIADGYPENITVEFVTE